MKKEYTDRNRKGNHQGNSIRDRLVNSLCCLLPFAAALLTLPGGYFFARTDAPEYLFGTALNFLTNDPLTIWHLPGYFWTEVSALILLVTGLPENSLHLFQFYGLVFQVLIILLVSWWSGGLSVSLKLSPFSVFLISLICASMPSALAYSKIWGHNYPVSALTILLALGAYLILTVQRNSRRTVFSILFVMGFLVANFFMALNLVFSFFIGLCWVTLAVKSPLEDRLGVAGKPRLWEQGAVLLCGFFLFKTFTKGLHETLLSDVLFLLCILVVLRRLNRVQRIQAWIYGLALPLMCGWLLGANVLAPYWGKSLWKALYGLWAGADPSIKPWLLKADLLGFIQTCLWNNFFVLSCVFSGIIFLHKKTLGLNTADRSVAIFATLGLAGSLIMAGKSSLVFPQGNEMPPGGFGIYTQRYYLLVPVYVSVLVLSLWKSDRILRTILVGLCFGLSCLSFGEYVLSTQPFVKHKRLMNHLIGNEIDSQLKRQDGAAVVVRISVPGQASILYGFNNYRTVESLRKLSKRTLGKNGRIIYVNDFTEINTLAKLRRLLPRGVAERHTILVHEGLSHPSYLFDVWHDSVMNLSVSRLKR